MTGVDNSCAPHYTKHWTDTIPYICPGTLGSGRAYQGIPEVAKIRPAVLGYIWAPFVSPGWRYEDGDPGLHVRVYCGLEEVGNEPR